MPADHIHQPWLAPTELLAQCGVRLGTEYPAPVVPLEESKAALARAYGVIQKCQARRTRSEEPYRHPTVPIQARCLCGPAVERSDFVFFHDLRCTLQCAFAAT